MFGKAYFLGLGIMLFIVGSLLSFASGMATELCAQLEAFPKGFNIAFNPCTIYQALPMIGLFMQVLGAMIAAITIILIIRAKQKPALLCPNCREKVLLKSVYCPKCGTKLPQPAGAGQQKR